MRVLHAVEAFGGGQLELIRQVAVGGVLAGESVAVAYGTRPQTPTDLSGWTDQGVSMIPVASWAGRSPLKQLNAPRELRRIVAEWRPDLIHLHSSFAGVAGALALRGQAPLLFSPQAFASTLGNRSRAGKALMRAAERFVLARVTVTVASSPSEARYSKEVLGADRVELVENGIAELDEPVLVEETPTDPLVIAGGRLVSQRQPEACARIMTKVGGIAKIRWVGGADGDRRRSGLAALTEAGVEVTGWVPREQALEQLRSASVYLHWTATDGLPLSVLEAMALDVPVVASDIPPCRDLLPPEQICGSEADAAALIRRIVADQGLAGQIRTAQRERRPRYAASRMVERMLALYPRIVDAPGS
jgi:glycosyltransferase involved in cell wall biosynthesis